MLEYLECIATSIQWIFTQFQLKRLEVKDELMQPVSEVLQGILQKKYYPTIIIENNDNKASYIYSRIENAPVFVFSNEELNASSPLYNIQATELILYDASFPFNAYNYEVILPPIPLDIASIQQLVAKYNLAGIKYIIRYA